LFLVSSVIDDQGGIHWLGEVNFLEKLLESFELILPLKKSLSIRLRLI